MIKRQIDFSRDLTYVKYGRMSSERQNPCSPDQQFGEIDRELARQRRAWTHLGDYRDDAESGKRLTNRPGMRRRLQDITTVTVRPHAILVDTWERFGRAQDLPALRHGCGPSTACSC